METGRHWFENKEKILSNLGKLLRPGGLFVLQDDRGTIFSEEMFAEAGFRKAMKEAKVVFKDNKGRSLGWNVLAVYEKTR